MVNRRCQTDQVSSPSGSFNRVTCISVQDREILLARLASPALSNVGVPAREPRAEADSADIPSDDLSTIDLHGRQCIRRNASFNPINKAVDRVQRDRADAISTVAHARCLKDTVEVVNIIGAPQGVDHALVIVKGTRGEDHVVVYATFDSQLVSCHNTGFA